MAGSYVPIPNLSGLSPAVLSSMYTSATTELLLRTTTGRVHSGSSAAQAYGLHVLSDASLIGLINSLTDALGLDQQITTARPNFNTPSGPYDPFTTTGNPI